MALQAESHTYLHLFIMTQLTSDYYLRDPTLFDFINFFSIAPIEIRCDYFADMEIIDKNWNIGKNY
jgi:hypothetical protein